MKGLISIQDILNAHQIENKPISSFKVEEIFFTSNFSNETLFKTTKSSSSAQTTNEVLDKIHLTSQVNEELYKAKPNITGSDSYTLTSGWKNIANISSRLIEILQESVILECLIDKEISLYEEREFDIGLFTGYDLTIGNLFYVRLFERPNQKSIQIIYDSNLVSKDDFPDMDFSKLFSSSKLFN